MNDRGICGSETNQCRQIDSFSKIMTPRRHSSVISLEVVAEFLLYQILKSFFYQLTIQFMSVHSYCWVGMISV